MSTYLDLEILHTLPFSNANRDDAGQPKTVVVGGVARGRLSSQSLKRAARFYGADVADGFTENAGSSTYLRTKRVRNLVLDHLEASGVSDPDILARVDKLFGEKSPLGKVSKGKGNDDSLRQDTLVVVTREEVARLAELIVGNENPSAKDINAILASSAKRDLALWGRFFASSDVATLDGSAQVAHAFTTHAVNVEPDFFVGLDDASPLYSDNAGAGHPGDAFFLTGTFYKYANINIEETILNLLNIRVTNKGFVSDAPLSSVDELTTTLEEVVADFIRSFALSVPQGKIRATAHQTLPSLVRTTLRKDRPVSGATAFDAPIRAGRGNDIVIESAKALAATHTAVEAFVGAPLRSNVLAVPALAGVSEELGEVSSSLEALISDSIEGLRELVIATLEKVVPPASVVVTDAADDADSLGESVVTVDGEDSAGF